MTLRKFLAAAFCMIAVASPSFACAQTTLNPVAAGAASEIGGFVNSFAPTSSIATGRLSGIDGRSFLTYSVPASATPYDSAVLNLNVSTISRGPNDLEIYDVTTNPTVDSQDVVYVDLGSGTLFGGVSGLATNNAVVQVTLSPAGLAAINAARGSTISFGFSNATVTNNGDQIFGGSAGSTPRELILTVAPTPSIPTLSEWAMISLGLLLAGGAAVMVQRRHMTA